VVDDIAKLRERVQFMHEQIGSDALVEEYIEGRELYVGMLGNERLTRMPVWEMRFGSLPESLPAIATRKVKWDRAYQKRYDITTRAADDLPPAVLHQLDRLSRPYLPCAAPVGLRPHRFSRARGRQRVHA
jgi:D-alanine-D-alanine ligase